MAKVVRLHSYVVEHDYGFAPNPFYGTCTLATCKPGIRAGAAVGDYIIGTGTAKNKRRGYLVHFMVVEEITTFDKYWEDWRFAEKRPIRTGSKMQFVGDNIYHRAKNGAWQQANSVHSYDDGSPNPFNIERDTKSENVLVSKDFAYFGGQGPAVPAHLRNFEGVDLVAKRGHKNNSFSEQHKDAAIAWLRGLDETGCIGTPLDWPAGFAARRNRRGGGR